MRVAYFGVRGSCPCSSDQYRRYGGNTSCVLIEVDGERPLILDLGTGLRALGDHLEVSHRGAGTPWRATALLTHLHYDHVLGLPFFAPLHDPEAVLDVYGPAQDGASLHEVMADLVQPPFFPIHLTDLGGSLRFHDLGGPADFSIGSINVKARPIPHVGHTLGFRVEAEGRSVAYISDHQAPVGRQVVDPLVLELCTDADLIIHDAQYTDEEFAKLSDWGHSTMSYAVLVAQMSGARRLSLFHHDPAHSDEEIDQMLSSARRTAARRTDGDPPLEVSAAAEGTSWDLGKA